MEYPVTTATVETLPNGLTLILDSLARLLDRSAAGRSRHPIGP